MAEIDPEKVGRSGIDPITGSVLSQEVRNSLLKRTTFDSSIFRNDLLTVQAKTRDIELENANIASQQENVLNAVNLNIQALRSDISKLGSGLANIGLLLQQDGEQDQYRTRVEQERQRRLTEQQIRIGKENDIEQKIQNSLLGPVQKLTPKIQNIFGNIGSALTILFAGWLTKQVVDAMKASEEGNTKKFDDIKFNIIKNLGIVGGGLLAIKAGFSLVKKTIAGIALGLTKLVIKAPLELAAGLLRIPRLSGGEKTPETPETKPKGGSGFGLGSLVNLAFGAFDFLQRKKEGQTNLQAGAGSASTVAGAELGGKIGSKFPGFTKLLAIPLLSIGGGMLAGKGSDVLTGVDKPKTEPKPATTKPTSTAPVPTLPAVKPQTPMMGEQKPSTPSLSPEITSKLEKAWKNRNNPFARDMIEDAWEKASPEQKEQAKDWAKSKGYNWSEMKLSDPSPAMSSTSVTSQTSKENMSADKMTPSTQILSSAQVTPPPKEPVKVGQLPEPKPSLTMIKTSNTANQQQNVPATDGALSDVPLINSANPDNFYVLYSQLTYNVVI